MSEKSEKPTPKKLQDAKKKGQVAKSKEIAATASIIGLFAYFWFFFDTYIERSKYILEAPAGYFDKPIDEALVGLSKLLLQEFSLLSFPFVLTAMVFIILSYFIQIGLLISFHPIKPDVKKINPVQGIKRIFSMNTIVELAKSIVKILLIGTICYLLIKGHLHDLLNVFRGRLEAIPELLGVILKKLSIAVSALFICVSIIDHFLQKHMHIRNNKMTKDEVKREYKDREGDPLVKGYRRQIQREMADATNITTAVKEATVVLVEPRKKVVVLKYVQGQTPLPLVTYKGKEGAVKKVMSAARKFQIPLYRAEDLTSKLYAQCQQNDIIPTELISRVAEIFRDIYTQNEEG